jgi:hypothetical protein
MIEAASLLPGRCDFAAFCDRDEDAASTLVEVSHSEVIGHADLLLFRIGALPFI